MSYRTTGLIDRRVAAGGRGSRHAGVRAGPHRRGRGVQRRGLHPEGVGLGGPLAGGRRGGADPRRLRLRGGVSHRARLPRQPGEPHLRGHERDQPAAGAGHAAQARRQGRSSRCLRAREERRPGRRARRGPGRRDGAARPREAHRRARTSCCSPTRPAWPLDAFGTGGWTTGRRCWAPSPTSPSRRTPSTARWRVRSRRSRSPVAEACVRLYAEEAHARACARARAAVLRVGEGSDRGADAPRAAAPARRRGARRRRSPARETIVAATLEARKLPARLGLIRAAGRPAPSPLRSW